MQIKVSRIKTPNTYFIIFILISLVAVLTWILPTGQYERVVSGGREIVQPGSYRSVASNPQGIGAVLMAPLRGFVDAGLIIGFVLLVGGAFSVFQKTRAIDEMIRGIAKAHKNSALIRTLLIPLFMVIFSLAGAVFGMSEEVIPFILIFVPLALTLGYDSVTGVSIPFVGAGVGFAGAFLNPFTIGIAQGLTGLPLFSGIGYRFVVWVIVTATAIFFVMRYALKIRNNPAQSFMYEKDLLRRADLHLDEIDQFSGLSPTHLAVLLTFLGGLVVMITGVLRYNWFIEEMSAVFLATGIAVGIVGRMKIGEITTAFVSGAKDLVGTALIIGLARGILLISREGLILDAMLNFLAGPIDSLPPMISAQFMFIIQSVINFFVPSGSGQAALTMPIIGPLADLTGISRQTAVLAFQFGDGFSNMIIPTSAVTMSVLSLADIPWEKWARWILPLEVIFLVLGLLLLIPPFLINWQ